MCWSAGIPLVHYFLEQIYLFFLFLPGFTFRMLLLVVASQVPWDLSIVRLNLYSIISFVLLYLQIPYSQWLRYICCDYKVGYVI